MAAGRPNHGTIARDYQGRTKFQPGGAPRAIVNEGGWYDVQGTVLHLGVPYLVESHIDVADIWRRCAMARDGV